MTGEDEGGNGVTHQTRWIFPFRSFPLCFYSLVSRTPSRNSPLPPLSLESFLFVSEFGLWPLASRYTRATVAWVMSFLLFFCVCFGIEGLGCVPGPTLICPLCGGVFSFFGVVQGVERGAGSVSVSLEWSNMQVWSG